MNTMLRKSILILSAIAVALCLSGCFSTPKGSKKSSGAVLGLSDDYPPTTEQPTS